MREAGNRVPAIAVMPGKIKPGSRNHDIVGGLDEEIRKLMKTYVQYPPRKLQSGVYTGSITISNYQKFQWVREQLAKEGIGLPLPTGN